MKTIHVSVNIDHLLRMDDAKLMETIVSFDPMTVDQVRSYLQELKGDGYEVVPPCDHHDDRGHCLGHDKDGGE